MKYLAAPAMILMLACSPVVAEESSRLKVSATVLPRPCEYPDRCENSAGHAVPPAATRVVASNEGINYVGSPPTVEKKDDLLVVKF